MAPLYCHLEVHTHRPRRRSIDRLSGWEEPSVYYPTARLPIARPQPIDPTYDVIERESQKHEETVGFERAMFLIDGDATEPFPFCEKTRPLGVVQTPVPSSSRLSQETSSERAERA